jgi:hypothetical protein
MKPDVICAYCGRGMGTGNAALGRVRVHVEAHLSCASDLCPHRPAFTFADDGGST